MSRRTKSAPAPTRALPDPAGRPRRRFRWHHLIPIVLVLAGITLLLYPVLATQYNNYRHHQFAQKYNNDINKVQPDVRTKVMAEALAYNRKNPGVPILDPYLDIADGDPTSGQWRAYRRQLAISDAMARVRVPTARIDLPVRHGTSQRVLAEGAGHLYGTSLPVGGPNTHAVMTSHTGFASASLFDHLNKVKKGDYMFVDVLGETHAYRVDQIKIVLPSEIGDLKSVHGKEYLTLFTCTPYAVNSHRLLVRGERVPYTPEVKKIAQEQADSVFVMETWMWWLIAGAVAGLLTLVLMIWSGRRRKRRGGATATAARRADTDSEGATDEEASHASPRHGYVDDDGPAPAPPND